MRKIYKTYFTQESTNVSVCIIDITNNSIVHDFLIPEAAISSYKASQEFDSLEKVKDYLTRKFGDKVSLLTKTLLEV